uniref:Protein phosphatase 1 regulatory subunit 27 isoform X2 n=1 Tax=Geotrypetes seraphini TaxID=260995 RepID=A0A6P8SF04_GEOSA|nr:protein phosphatase 1 regulatory subunit 27 isoform X2 [Geotrypetes seraphini]
MNKSGKFSKCLAKRKVFRAFRKWKKDPKLLSTSGMAALHEAVLTGNLECVKLLVKYGADIHQQDENGWTPLHMACSDNHADIARYLVSLGAKLDVTNNEGEKPSDLIDPDCKEMMELFTQDGVD